MGQAAYSKQTAEFLSVVRHSDFVVLDTETTGLDSSGEIIQIAIVDVHGNSMFNSFVRPMESIPNTDIHGISDADVIDAPRWSEIDAAVQTTLHGRDVIVYNATYDRRMLSQSAKACKVATEWKETARWHCAMLAYAEFYGDWDDYRGSYRWQKLTDAMEQQSLAVSEAHTALGDALMTLELVKKIAGLSIATEPPIGIPELTDAQIADIAKSFRVE